MAARKRPAAPEPEVVRRFELPYHAEVGRLVNGRIGLRSVAQRAGAYAPYTMDVTLLDAPDHRLIRSGIWLAHRVLEGRGEWYLAAPQWSPWLPAEQIELMGHDDLPDTFASLVRPFRRGAALGPVAALHCRREEYALRGDAGDLVATLRNEAVTIRSGGIVTARYREVTLTGVEGRLQPAQVNWLTELLTQAGATRVEAFPALAQRLGAPATGLADIPTHREPTSGGSLEAYVQTLFARRLRRITHADVALRGGQADASAQLARHLHRTLTDVRGLAPLFDRAWATPVEAELDLALTALAGGAPGRVPSELDSQRYLRLLDRLVAATRAPSLGDAGPRPAGEVLRALLADRTSELADSLAALDPDGPLAAWEAAHDVATRVADTCGVQPGRDRAVRRLRRRATRLAAMLEPCVQVDPDTVDAAVERLAPREAFEAGREFEQAYAEQHIARLDLLDHWERRGDRLAYAGERR